MKCQIAVKHNYVILFTKQHMFRSKRPSSGHHYKNSKNKVQCSTN